MSEGDSYSDQYGEHKVFVGGLSVNCEDFELKDYLQRFGSVLHCEIIRDKNRKSKGYGFATFSDDASVKRSVGKQHYLKGKCFEIRIQVDSNQNSELLQAIAKRKIFVSNLKQAINENDLARFFGRFGAVEEVLISRDPATQLSKGFGFVVFVDSISAKNALYGQSKRNVRIKNHDIVIKEAIPKKEILKQRKAAKDGSESNPSDTFIPDMLGDDNVFDEGFFEPFHQMANSGLATQNSMDMNYNNMRLVSSFAHPSMTPDMGFDINYFMVDPEPRSRSVLYPAQHSHQYIPLMHQNTELPAQMHVPNTQQQSNQTYCPLKVEIVADLPDLPATEWTGESLYNSTPDFNYNYKDALMHAETFCDTPSMLEPQSLVKQETKKHKKSFFSSVVSQTVPDITIVGNIPQLATYSCGCPVDSSNESKSFDLVRAVQPKGCVLSREPLDTFLRGSGVLPDLFLPNITVSEESSCDSADFRWSVLASNCSKDDKLLSPCRIPSKRAKKSAKAENESFTSRQFIQQNNRSEESETRTFEGDMDFRSHEEAAI